MDHGPSPEAREVIHDGAKLAGSTSSVIDSAAVGFRFFCAAQGEASERVGHARFLDVNAVRNCGSPIGLLAILSGWKSGLLPHLHRQECLCYWDSAYKTRL
jgi:hypothetical protein